MTAAGKDRERLAREQRLAAALRDNLKRRKVQSRARSAPEATDPPAAHGSAGQGCAGASAEPQGSGSHDSAGIVTEKQSGIDG